MRALTCHFRVRINVDVALEERSDEKHVFRFLMHHLRSLFDAFRKSDTSLLVGDMASAALHVGGKQFLARWG